MSEHRIPKPSIAKNILISQSALSEIEAAFLKYVDEVLASHLSERAQANYIDQADNFLRWNAELYQK